MADAAMPPRQVLEMSREQCGEWHDAIAQAIARSKQIQPWWESNLKAYAPSATDSPEAYGSTLNTNRDFTLVERKKADLFYQQPDIQAVPSPLMQDQAPILETHTAILQQKLGLQGVGVKDLTHRALFDVLCTAGTGFTVMGYESATVPVEHQIQVGEEPAVGSVLGLGATTPIMQTVVVPVPVHEDVFWRPLSPKQMLIPATFRSTRWDDAPFLGYRMEWPLRVAKRQGWVPERFDGQSSDAQEIYFTHGQDRGTDATVRGSVIYYKSALYRDDIVHPLHLTLVIFLDGIDEPVEHKNCPYQTIDPQSGALTADSLIGYPIHPLTVRTMTDAAYVPSDCTISRPLVNELNRFRGQMVEQRDANILRWQYNVDVLPPDALSKMVRSPIGGMIGVPNDAFVGEGAIKELPHGTYPRENFSFNDYLDNDLARTHALDANQAGVQAEGDQTATEASLRQTNANARLGLERGIVLDWYIRGVTKYSTLIQRFLPLKDAVTIVGQQQAAAWDQWRHLVPASVAFTAMPDAALRNDLATERKRAMDEYSFFARDPLINRQELLKHIFPKLHYPSSVLQTTAPPKEAEPAKPQFSFKGDDLNPLSPQFPIVVAILQQTGITISPDAIAQAQQGSMNQLLQQHALAVQQPTAASGTGSTATQTQHGGKVAQTENLSKHHGALTGGIEGIGQIQ